MLAELSALPVEDVAGQRVAAFTSADHVADRAAICWVVDVSEHAQGLDYPAEFGQLPVSALEWWLHTRSWQLHPQPLCPTDHR